MNFRDFQQSPTNRKSFNYATSALGMAKEVFYFGYGASRSAELMNTLIGRKPKSFPASLLDFELCTQTLAEMPQKVASKLNNPPANFKPYFVRRKNEGRVAGRVWQVREYEKKIIGIFEMRGLWYKLAKVRLLDKRGKVFEAETDIIDNPNIGQTVNGNKYLTFLSNEDKTFMFDAANSIRQTFFNQKEPQTTY